MEKKSLNERQRKFLEIKTKNPGISNYQAAIKAGYSPNYAKNITEKMVENGGIGGFLDTVLNDEALANLINEGALALKRDRFSGELIPDYRIRHLYISDILELKGYKKRLKAQIDVWADVTRRVEADKAMDRVRKILGGEEPQTEDRKEESPDDK